MTRSFTGANQFEQMEKHKKVCLLTGAGGRLGNALCRHLAPEFNIIGIYRNKLPDWPSQETEYINPLNASAHFEENDHKIFVIRTDLYNDNEINNAVETALSQFEKIDLLINAAVYYSYANMIDSNQLLDSIKNQFFLNAVVPLKLSVLLARNFWKGRDGENKELNRNIINISSIAGINVYKNIGQSGYSASKAALNMLTKHMADEFGEFGIRVNALAPNTFPKIVGTQEVLDGVAVLNQSNCTGKILVIDKDRKYYI